MLNRFQFAECCVETGDVVVAQRQRTSGKVFGEVAASTRPGDQQHVVSDRQQPGESELGRRRTVVGSHAVDHWISPNGVMLFLGPAQWTERDERDAPGGALLEHWRRRPIREVVRVLYADDVGDFERHQQVPVSDVADPYTCDQTFVPAVTNAPSCSTNLWLGTSLSNTRRFTAVSCSTSSVARFSSMPARS